MKSQQRLKNKENNNVYCLTYNYNLDDAFVATNLGMEDMLIISLKIDIANYPKDSLTSGVHITLLSQGATSEVDYGIMASPGELFIVRLKKTVNEFLNSTSIETFDGKISTMGNFNFEKNFGAKNDTVALAFTYEDLNVIIVRELPPYNILTFLSETGGILGLLLGTNVVSLIVFILQWAWGLRINEYNWFSVKNKLEKRGNEPESSSYCETEVYKPSKSDRNEKIEKCDKNDSSNMYMNNSNTNDKNISITDQSNMNNENYMNIKRNNKTLISFYYDIEDKSDEESTEQYGIL